MSYLSCLYLSSLSLSSYSGLGHIQLTCFQSITLIDIAIAIATVYTYPYLPIGYGMLFASKLNLSNMLWVIIANSCVHFSCE